jgi:hypothetical protein
MSIIPFNFFLYIYLFYFSNFFFPILSLFMFSFLPTSYSYSLLFPSLIQSPPHICAAYLTSQHRLPRSPNVLPAWAIPDGVVELFPSVLPPPAIPALQSSSTSGAVHPRSEARSRPSDTGHLHSRLLRHHPHDNTAILLLHLVYTRQAAPPSASSTRARLRRPPARRGATTVGVEGKSSGGPSLLTTGPPSPVPDTGSYSSMRRCRLLVALERVGKNRKRSGCVRGGGHGGPGWHFLCNFGQL